MRARTPIFVCLWLLFAAHDAQAAPTCQDKTGITTKCGTPGAMPVGWTPTPAQVLARESANPPGADGHELWQAVCVVALFLALIALLPDFDGSRAGDWDRQEDDDARD
jgi:hypothetical protein